MSGLDRFRSGLEKEIAQQLQDAGHPFQYETDVARIPYYPPPDQKKRYTPDFWLANGIVIEAKGHLTTSNRRKLKHVKVRYPDLDLRLVFSRAENTIGKKSDTTYAKWAEDHGFPWADDGTIPEAWIQEPPEKGRIQAIKEVKYRWENRLYDPDAEIPDDL